MSSAYIYQDGSIEVPPEWLRPMSDDELRNVACRLFYATFKAFKDDRRAATKYSIEGVWDFLRRHDRELPTLEDLAIFLGMPKKRLH